jgi:two-component sensor histidine kinase
MDVYSQKSNLKLILLLLGTFIGTCTVLYTNHLANRMADEERHKARLWAEAIARKATLVRYTKELFSKLAEDELNKVTNYRKSTEFLLTTTSNDERNFFLDIITSNQDIPTILTDDQGQIDTYRNIPLPKSVKYFSQLPLGVRKEFTVYPPIVIDNKLIKKYLYYKDSNLFGKLKQTLNDLVETFISEVVVNSASAPVILTDQKGNILAYGGLDSVEMKSKEYAAQMISRMTKRNGAVAVDLGEGEFRYIYYDDSETLKQLRIFPFVQLGIFAVFLFISYLAFSSARRSEQNLVWVGMAKETAHQLGTPISSLEGWIEYLKDVEGLKEKPEIIGEIENDVNRLALVAERFSKIGSVAKLQPENVYATLERNVNYMRRRASEKVKMTLTCTNDLSFKINKQLFDWVIENLLKNALDAMDGEGHIEVDVSTDSSNVIVDVTDSGKGIPKGKFDTIFEPGYSTKRRGWGLGLSLTRRIVQEYHKGKIFVKRSEVGKGTTFRITIPRS